MLRREIENIIVRHIKLSLREIRRAVASVVLVESEQAMPAMTFDVRDQARQTLDNLGVRAPDVVYSARAEINLEFDFVERMSPGAHLRIDKSAVGPIADSRDVRVIVEESGGIDIVEGALDEIGSLRADVVLLFFRLMSKGAGYVMNEAHRIIAT